jgi:hypothetical protein
MFNSRIHFRTNTFDILSHLADRQTTDARYIHVRLLTYFHKCVYLLCKFQEFKTHEYIFQDHFKIFHSE